MWASATAAERCRESDEFVGDGKGGICAWKREDHLNEAEPPAKRIEKGTKRKSSGTELPEDIAQSPFWKPPAVKRTWQENAVYDISKSLKESGVPA